MNSAILQPTSALGDLGPGLRRDERNFVWMLGLTGSARVLYLYRGEQAERYALRGFYGEHRRPRRATSRQDPPWLHQQVGVSILVWYELHDTREGAFRRERQIKEWRRAWKLRLIEERNPTWRDLYEELF